MAVTSIKQFGPSRCLNWLERVNALVVAAVLFLPGSIGFVASASSPPLAEHVPNQIIVKFRDDVARYAPNALSQGFRALSGDPAAASLDALFERHQVQSLRRLHRSFEDRQGRLKTTARDQAQEGRRRRVARGRAVPPKREVPQLENIFVLDVDSETDIATALVEFMRDPRVEYAEPNYIYHLNSHPLPSQPLIPDDHYLTQDGVTWAEGAFGQSFPNLYGLENIQALEGWNDFFNTNPPDGEIGAGEIGPGEGVVVAVIDSGIDVSHPDLAGNVWQNDDPVNGSDDDGNNFTDDVNGYDFVEDSGVSIDPNGHGTHVAGTIAAVADNAIGVAGVAPFARLMNSRAFGVGGTAILDDIAEAVVYAVDNQADILSNSWTGNGSSQALLNVFAYAADNGVLSIAAAGNDNDDVDRHYPGNFDSVLSVAAVDHTNVRAYFSNFGDLVDVAAPGVDVLSANANGGVNTIAQKYPNNVVDTDYLFASGTSMACPHVSGAAAVLMSYFPGDSAPAIWGRLRAGADSIDSLNPGFEGLLGKGRINLLRSLNATPAPDVEFAGVHAANFIAGSQGAITLQLRNFWAPTAGVTVALTSANPLLTVDVGSVDFGPIGTGELVSNSSTPFLVTVSPAAQPGDEFTFTGTATLLEGGSVVKEFFIRITLFTDVTRFSGLPASGIVPRGIRVQDYDGDGITDIRLDDAYFNAWYRGRGDGTFEDVTNQLGIDPDLSGAMTLFFDADNDGDEDFLIGSFGTMENPTHTTRLLRNNGDGTVTDITGGSGFESAVMVNAVVFDYDKDGWNDILGLSGDAIYEGDVIVGYEPLYLMRNNGDLTFSDVRASTGLPETPLPDGTGQILIFDVTGQGNPSILFVSFYDGVTPDDGITFWQSTGFGTFVDASDSAFMDPLPATAWGAAVGDYDDDGDVDLHLTSSGTQYLFRYNGSQFADVTATAGDLANVSITSISPGSEFIDYDNDGDLDLYLTRDAPFGSGPPFSGPELFENLGNGTFSRVSDIAFPEEFTPTFNATGFGDLEGDGALDIYAPQSFAKSVGKGGLLRNNLAGKNHWLKTAFDGGVSARDAYGARVELTAGGKTQVRELRSGALDTSSLHFGLGDAEIVDEILVRWPSGINQYWERVAVNQSFELVECGGPLPAECGNGICEAGGGEDCLSCPGDCNGKQSGKKAGQFCCGGDAGSTNPVSCTDNRCTSSGFSCTDSPVTPSCCGNGACESGEDSCSCSFDCGAPPAQEEPALTCGDGLNNDCDEFADCDDPDCADACQSLCDGDQVCEPSLGEDCMSCPSDCNGKTSGKPSGQFCCGSSVDCTDSRCNESGFSCEGAICGDGFCDSGEDSCSCSFDCGAPPTQEDPDLTCNDGLDNDCNGVADCDDLNCAPACQAVRCGNQVCEPGLGEDCLTCPSDCNGKTSGKPSGQFCCGASADCGDSRCNESGFVCTDDIDADGLPDSADNCLVLANGTGTSHVPNPRPNGSNQCDDDLDGFGNLCDCDFDNSGMCDQVDADLFSANFGLPVDATNGIYDLDCDQVIGFSDAGIFTPYLDKQMGVDEPLLSGLDCADATSTGGGCASP